MKLKAGKAKRKDYGCVSPEVSDILHQLDAARKLKKDKLKTGWRLAQATATTRFLLIGKPSR